MNEVKEMSEEVAMRIGMENRDAGIKPQPASSWPENVVRAYMKGYYYEGVKDESKR